LGGGGVGEGGGEIQEGSLLIVIAGSAAANGPDSGLSRTLEEQVKKKKKQRDHEREQRKTHPAGEGKNGEGIKQKEMVSKCRRLDSLIITRHECKKKWESFRRGRKEVVNAGTGETKVETRRKAGVGRIQIGF